VIGASRTSASADDGGAIGSATPNDLALDAGGVGERADQVFKVGRTELAPHGVRPCFSRGDGKTRRENRNTTFASLHTRLALFASTRFRMTSASSTSAEPA
jgi:hypothetical protein